MADLFAGATPVLYEEMSDHTGGAWIGYADGHLEFAASPPEFAARGDAMPPLRDAVTRYGNPLVGSADPAVHRQPAAPAADAAKIKPRGNLKLLILDPDGRPVPGARVGREGLFGDLHPPAERVNSWASDTEKDEQITSDERGEATM